MCARAHVCMHEYLLEFKTLARNLSCAGLDISDSTGSGQAAVVEV